MENWRNHIHFILVNPREPGNIGASARAIKNMGFSQMHLVNPPENFMEGHDFWLACHATDLLEKAHVHHSLPEAIREMGLVVGTTRRTGKKRGIILPLTDGVQKIRDAAKINDVAILFGREDRGLTNEETEECGLFLTIPTSQEAPSLNLAQAVLLTAYELGKQEPSQDTPEFVPQQEMRSLYGHLRKTLKLLGYIPRGDVDMEERIMRNFRHLFGRSGLTQWEVGMLHGICSQIERMVEVKRKDG
ncbi:MAG: RNA methyltransferase [Nitrospirae bacterium]|nr:MAG: RNA methyltransferase [Nitrospirota bacterium]